MKTNCKNPVIVSACLVGLDTRYNGRSASSTEVADLLKGRSFVPVCPEQLGGLPTPRPKATIVRGSGEDVLNGTSRVRVVDELGADVTEMFSRGAQAVLKVARMCGSQEAFLKENSPSCGVTRVHRETGIAEASGVTAALLKKNGIAVKGF